MFKINVERAKEIQKEIVRSVRAEILAQLDIEYVRALESKSNVKSIIEKKQKLRDFPKLVSDATITGSSIDEITKEIKSIWDEELLGEHPFKTPPSLSPTEIED